MSDRPTPARPRLLVRRIWRAFPELDGFDDAQCARWVTALRSLDRKRFVVRAILLVLVLGAVAGFGAGFMLTMQWRGWQFELAGPHWWLDGALLAGALLIAFLLLLAILLIRDRLLRIQLHWAVGRSGRCPVCSQSLAGLAVPDSLTVICPECGFLCAVDLRALRSEGSGAALQPLGDFWSPERRKRWRRRGAWVAVMIAIAVAIPLAIHEIGLRWDAATARRERPTREQLIAIVERNLPGSTKPVAPGTFNSVLAIQRLANRFDEIAIEAHENLPEHLRQDAGWLANDQIGIHSAMREGDSPYARVERATLAFAYAAIARCREVGYFDLVVELQAQPARPHWEALGSDPATCVFYGLAPEARQLGRLLSGSMMEALERGDTAEASQAFESLLALARHLEAQPRALSRSIASSIEHLAHTQVMRWIASAPDAAALDAIEAAITRQSSRTAPAMHVQIEEAFKLMRLADIFDDPAEFRFGRIGATAQNAFGIKPGERVGSWRENRDLVLAVSQWTIDRLEATGQPLNLAPPPPRADVIVDRLTQHLELPPDWEAIRESKRRSLRLQIALERHRLQHGAYPESLEQLHAYSRDELPIDPRDGAVVIYRRIDPATDLCGRGFLLYLPGPDGVDDGGHDEFSYHRFWDRVPETNWFPPGPTMDVLLSRAAPLGWRERPEPPAPPARGAPPVPSGRLADE